MHQQIVDKRASRSHQSGILRLPVGKSRGIVAGDVLHQVQRVRPAHLDFAHVADVEESGRRPRRQLLATMPEYSTGMSQPPKFTILAPMRR